MYLLPLHPCRFFVRIFAILSLSLALSLFLCVYCICMQSARHDKYESALNIFTISQKIVLEQKECKQNNGNTKSRKKVEKVYIICTRCRFSPSSSSSFLFCCSLCLHSVILLHITINNYGWEKKIYTLTRHDISSLALLCPFVMYQRVASIRNICVKMNQK